MSNVTTQIAEHVWTIITYEEAWKSYINSYVLAKNDKFVLIDSHLRKHRPYLQEALQQIGVTPEKIEHVYVTHRHADHIGNVDLFPSRNNWIHLEDYYELDDFSQTLFGHTFTGSGGDVPFLQFKQIPFHTEGSVAFFDSKDKVCFVGDHLCFFATTLANAVGHETERREEYLHFLKKWKTQEPERVASFVQGLESILNWPIELLATGHGSILRGDIHDFLKQVIKTVSTP